ncbi:MAG: SRPBCC family protein [Rhodospirillales bacterium]
MKPKIPLTAALPSDRELQVSREFDAPRELVFKAYTDPALVVRWLFGPDDWPMAECTIDLRVGGAYRYVWRNEQQGDMAMGGTFKEIAPPERLVVTELFDQDWTEGETVCTTTFEELDSGARTRVTTTVLYSSQNARDNAMKTPMLEGWAVCFDRMDGLLPELAG